jgi:predicted permease
MSQLTYQLKQAWASLSKKPGFVSTVVVTMGTTLGALLCIATLAYLLLLKPLPYPEQDNLYKVEHAVSDKTGETNAKAFTYPGLIHLYKNQDVFKQAALVHYGEDVLTSLPNQPTMNTAYVTPEWFNLLDTSMELGRRFELTEALDTNNPVAILSYKVWSEEYASDPNILSKKVDFSGISFNVVGVSGKNFVEPQIARTGRLTGVWFPWDYNLDIRMKGSWSDISGSLNFVGKLKDDITAVQAEQIITPLVNDTWKDNVSSIPFFAGWNINMELRSFQSVILGESENTVYLLLAGVFGLVIIACANIANLFMSRTAEQQRQLAIFAALGAKKSHLFKSIFAETGLLMLLSVGVSLIIASFSFYVLQQNLSEVLPRVSELAINGFTFGVAVFFALTFALLFAGLSLKMINYRALNSLLQSSGKGTGIQVSKRIRQVLIMSQVAIATVLVFANISLFKEAVETITEPTGFSVQNMSELSLSVSAPHMPPIEEVIPVMTELRKKLTELPQVKSVSITGSPLKGYGLWALSDVKANVNYTPYRKSVDNLYFDMIGQELVEGDDFSESDIKDRSLVMIVNDVFAKRLNSDGSVLGMQISPVGGGQPYTVIGVVKGIKIPGETEIPIRVYVPSNQAARTMILNLAENQTISREQVVSVLQQVSGLYAVFGLENLVESQKRMLFTQYTTAITTVVLAIITLFLAGVGLYGILSYSTQMRRFELGTRMAIGAKKKHLVGMIIKDNTAVILFGVLLSLVILLVLYIGYSEELIEYISLQLLPIFIATVLAITMLSLFACYWPLRQYVNNPAIHSLRGSD